MPDTRKYDRIVDKVTHADPGFKNGLRLGHDEIVALLMQQEKNILRRIKYQASRK